MNGFKFSLRTVLVLLTSVSVFAGCISFAAGNEHAPLFIFPAYIGLWILPGASIGYDRTPTWKGAIDGLMIGGLACLVFSGIASAFLPAVQ